MTKRFDQIIVGGGVMGASISYELSKRGYQVLLLEENTIAAEASSAAAGMLGVQMEFEADSPLFRFAKESRALFPRLAKELLEESGIDIQLIEKGALKLVYHQDEIDALKRIASFQTQQRVEAKVISPATIPEKELANDFYAALYCPTEGQVSAPHLTKAFAKAAEHHGAVIMEQTKVHDILSENGQVTGVKTAGKAYTADRVIMTCGFKSSQFPQYIKQFTPVKGECLSVITEKPLIQSTIFTEGCYLVPKRGNRIIIGATSKPNQTDKDVKVASVLHLLSRAKQILPALNKATIEKVWAGVRPLTKDGFPYLGEVPDVSGLYVATGHYRNGILLAPRTATFMADIVEGKQVDPSYLATFSLKRASLISV
ncbi:glycine oxidase ThiO [Gracilibacillus salitolerans]|uniref:glycine oxidase n=1 Tax=Gracilibacillus salitolerans TaxID=2663022 RepID=A0A5Q2TLU3_9BACI|nr:glycine oxidase ThiO [Gracilibacillus salitolerans]QGH35706.1 glycine oxidase ThiO [Gracilibacillus salitolerans]